MKKEFSVTKPTALFLLFVLIASFMSTVSISPSINGVAGEGQPFGAKLSDPPHLMINEFIATQIQNEGVELYNPPKTNETYDLSEWFLAVLTHPSLVWTNMTLSGSIVNGSHVWFDTSPPLALDDQSGDLYLFDNRTAGSPVLVDHVGYGTLGGCPDPRTATSACRAPDGQDTNDDAADWTVDETPTQGSANDAPAPNLGGVDVVLNEVLPSNGTGEKEYIELYNKNATHAVDISNWHILDGEDVYTIPSSTSIPSNGFYIARSNDTVWTALTYFGLADDGDNVYLYTNGWVKVDQMGWSTDHGWGMSLARFNDGVGICSAYDDKTSADCGWAEGIPFNGSPNMTNNGKCTHLWITRFTAGLVVLSRSNASVVQLNITNMRDGTTRDVNATLSVPQNVTLLDPSKRELGTLPGKTSGEYNVTTVKWDIEVVNWTRPGSTVSYQLNLTIEANPADTGNPRNTSTSVTVVWEVKAVFDISHGQRHGTYIGMEQFIDIMREMVGPYLRNEDEITSDTLEDVDLLVIPDPQERFKADEVTAIKNWIDNGGSLLILADYCKYLEPDAAWLNDITLGYGIRFIYGNIMDDNDCSSPGYLRYYPYIHAWADNDIANNLTWAVSSIAYSGTSLEVSGNAVPVAIGDNDPWPDDQTVALDVYTGYTWTPGVGPEPEHILAYGSDVIACAAVEAPSEGRIFASGGSAIFDDCSYYMCKPVTQNAQFARNVLTWLMHREFDMAITSVASIAKNTTGEYVAPAKTVVGKQSKGAYFNVAVKNQGLNTETGINVALYYRNATGDYLIGTQTGITLNPYQIYNITFTWDTTTVKRNWNLTGYTIFANVTVVSGEIDTADNTYIFGNVKVVIPGNVNADKQVNVLDLGKLGVHWLAKVEDPLYNPNVDINNDAVINVIDLGTLGFWWLEYE